VGAALIVQRRGPAQQRNRLAETFFLRRNSPKLKHRIGICGVDL
jgi:hypothetical protein